MPFPMNSAPKTIVRISHPSGFLWFLVCAPILLYRLKLGWLFGKRFLLLEQWKARLVELALSLSKSVALTHWERGQFSLRRGVGDEGKRLDRQRLAGGGGRSTTASVADEDVRPPGG